MDVLDQHARLEGFADAQSFLSTNRGDIIRTGYRAVRNAVMNRAWDYWTVVTGPEGVGKSTLAFKIAQAYDPDFSVDNVVYDADELISLIQVSKKGSVCLFDEAVEGAFARSAMSKSNKRLTRTAMMARFKGVHVIMCIPEIHLLDIYFRESRVRAWWYVYRRGAALLHMPVRNPYERSVWWFKTAKHFFTPVEGNEWDRYQTLKEINTTAAIERIMDVAVDEDGNPYSKAARSTIRPPKNDEAPKPRKKRGKRKKEGEGRGAVPESGSGGKRSHEAVDDPMGDSMERGKEWDTGRMNIRERPTVSKPSKKKEYGAQLVKAHEARHYVRDIAEAILADPSLWSKEGHLRFKKARDKLGVTTRDMSVISSSMLQQMGDNDPRRSFLKRYARIP